MKRSEISKGVVEVEAREMHDVTVDKVALVKHGAVRVPFRIIKSEGGQRSLGMLNLKPFQIFKTEPVAPQVLAVLVNKAADVDAAIERITKGGLSVENRDDANENFVVFAQVEGKAPDDAVLIKMDESIGVLVSGLAKSFEGINFTSESFNDVLAQEGLRPGVGLSLELLGSTFQNIMMKAESSEDLVAGIGQAVDEFRAHITAMAGAVPANAFSMDVMKVERAGAVPATQEGSQAGGQEDAGTAEATAAAKAEADAAEMARKAEADKATADAAEALAKAGKTAPAATGAEVAAEITKVLADQLGAITTKLAEVAGSVVKQGDDLKASTDRMVGLEAAIKTTGDAVAGLTGSEANGDPEGGRSTAGNGLAKSEGTIPLIDTGYDRSMSKSTPRQH